MPISNELYVVVTPDYYIVGPYDSFRSAQIAAGRFGSLSAVKRIRTAAQVRRLRRRV